MGTASQTLVPSRLPLVQAPMAGGPSTPELAAAVNAAGGFGYVAGGYLTPEAFAAALDRTRALTSEPVGVNLFVPSDPAATDAALVERYAGTLAAEARRLGVELGEPRWDDDAYRAKLDVAVAAAVHTVSFTFGAPSGTDVDRLHRAGIRVAVTVTSAEEAGVAADIGADLLVVQGEEAGGHQGTFSADEPNRTGLLDALREIDPVGLPMVGAGGITSADDAGTALDAGAVAVQVGTAFLCTPESGTSTPYRRALLDRMYGDTVVTRAFSGRWARGLRNRFALEHDDAPAAYPQIHHLTRPLRAAATAADDPDVPNLWAGTGWQGVRAEPAASVVTRLTEGL
jgi:nitronate monooxygenase